jgi:hypothetical protein
MSSKIKVEPFNYDKNYNDVYSAYWSPREKGVADISFNKLPKAARQKAERRYKPQPYRVRPGRRGEWKYDKYGKESMWSIATIGIGKRTGSWVIKAAVNKLTPPKIFEAKMGCLPPILKVLQDSGVGAMEQFATLLEAVKRPVLSRKDRFKSRVNKFQQIFKRRPPPPM